jgi:hypothetical protein
MTSIDKNKIVSFVRSAPFSNESVFPKMATTRAEKYNNAKIKNK